MWNNNHSDPDYCTLEDGAFPFSIEAADMTGNFCDTVTDTSSGDGITYDTISPVIELSGEYDEENGYYTGDVTLTFNEGISVLTNNSDETVSNPVSRSVVSAAGDYTLTVTDNAGNTATVEFMRNGDLLDAVEDRDSLEIIYGPGDRADHVTQDLGLPESGENGSAVSWTVTDRTAVTDAGVVTRPENSAGSQQVTLTATVTKGSGSAVKIFNLTVIALPGDTDADKAQDDADAASIYYAPDDNANSVTRDFELGAAGVYGSALTWSSGDTELVSIAETADGGRYAATVTRPAFADGDKTLTLTATATLGDEEKTQTFELTLKRLEGSDADYVKEDAATASIAYAGSDSGENMGKLNSIMEKYKDSSGYILFCLVGGLLGWLLQIIVNVQPATVMGWMGYGNLSEVAALPEGQELSVMYTTLRISSVIFSALLSCGLVFSMSVAEFKFKHSWGKAILNGLVFLALALPVGAVTGFLLATIYESCPAFSYGAGHVLYHGIGWGIIGIGIALTVSLTARSRKNIIGYSIAGLCSGVVTGIIFGVMSMPPAETNIFLKLVAAFIFGLLLGVGILLFKGITEKRIAPIANAVFNSDIKI